VKLTAALTPSRARQRGQHASDAATVGLKPVPQRSHLNISLFLHHVHAPGVPSGPGAQVRSRTIHIPNRWPGKQSAAGRRRSGLRHDADQIDAPASITSSPFLPAPIVTMAPRPRPPALSFAGAKVQSWIAYLKVLRARLQSVRARAPKAFSALRTEGS